MLKDENVLNDYTVVFENEDGVLHAVRMFATSKRHAMDCALNEIKELKNGKSFIPISIGLTNPDDDLLIEVEKEI